MLVIGATGETGRETVAEALRRGIPVTALVRRVEDAATFPAGVAVIVGDARDQAAVVRALSGQDVVVSTLGARKGSPVGTVRSDATRTIVAAMGQAGVQRIVAVSSIGVGESVAHMSRGARFMWPRIVGRDRLAEVERMERILASSGLDWTVVRPPRLMSGPATGKVQVGATVPTHSRSQLDRADLAHVLVDLATSGDAARSAVTAVAA